MNKTTRRKIFWLALLAAMAAEIAAVKAFGQIDNPIVRAEQLTDAQKKSIRDAEQKVEDANEALQKVKEGVAAEHGMKSERWMEWQSWWEIDGDFIIFRHHNSMR